MPLVKMPCEDRALSNPGCNGLTTAEREFPENYTPNEYDLSGYLCEACATLRAIAAQPVVNNE